LGPFTTPVSWLVGRLSPYILKLKRIYTIEEILPINVLPGSFAFGAAHLLKGLACFYLYKASLD
jgi:hypothetical protein